MQIIHRLSINSSAEIHRELSGLGFVVAASGLVTFEVDEAHEAWLQVQRWVARRKPIDITKTVFSKGEIAEAKWSAVVPNWHHGYPQPDELEFGYLEATYDLSDGCEQCGVGMKQTAPFQMKGEPKWGRNGMLQLNWVFDEYFTSPEVWKTVFEPHGVGSRLVLDTNGEALKTVVQLVVDHDVGIVTAGLPAEKCRRCGRTKYLPVTRGRFPALTGETPSSIARTTQYFGSGGSAQRPVLVSQALARAFLAENVRGASFKPVADALQVR